MTIAGASTTERERLALRRDDLFREDAFIGGDWCVSEHTINVRNPASGRHLGVIPDLGLRETDAAIAAAERAQLDWRDFSATERANILKHWFTSIIANREDLARLLTAEQGKPLSEARAEIAYAAGFVEWFAEEARRSYGEIIPGHTRDTRLSVLRRAVGVVAAITPWNFPAAMVTRKVAPALAAGCSVVLKPSELTPFTALALARLGEEAGLPAGVFNVVTGAPQPIGETLTRDERIAKFTFTGSTRIGKMLAARCMETVKRVSLELGGNAPFIVCADADIDRAVAGALASKFRNTGQTCVCANRFYVDERIYDSFAEALIAKVTALRVGDGLSAETDQGPLINEAGVSKVRLHIADAIGSGAQIANGGRSHALGGAFVEPTVLVNVDAKALVCREETFGPVAALVRVTDERHALQLANASRAGLAAYVFTSDFARAHWLTEKLEVGMVGLNTGLISTEVAPFGGCKESGIGREGARYGLHEFEELKTVYASVALN